MVVLSLVVALVAIVVAVLALRRADVVDRRVSKRLATPGDLAAPEPSGSDTSTGATAAGTTATGAAATSTGTTATGAISAPGPSSAESADMVARIAALESRTFDGISRVAVVRYDAFEGSGGLLSYSVALVDEQGHGLVLTAIHGQSETRTYVKEVPLTEDTARPAELSPEEREALRKATATPAGARSDRRKLGRKKLDRKSGR